MMLAFAILRGWIGSAIKAITKRPWLLLVALCAVLAIWGWSERSGKQSAQQQAKAERAAHAVSLESIVTLRKELDRETQEALARAKAFDDARQRGATEAKRNADAFRSVQGRIDAVGAAMGRDTERCEVPSDVAALLK